MLILDADKRKPSKELPSDSRIRRVSNFKCKDTTLLNTAKGEMTFENLADRGFLLDLFVVLGFVFFLPSPVSKPGAQAKKTGFKVS